MTTPSLAQIARDKPASLPAQQMSVAPSTLLATVNGRPVTEADLAPAAEDIGPELARIPEGRARDAYVLDYRIDSVLVAQEAKKKKYGEGTDFQHRLDYERNKLLADTLLKQIAASATSELALRHLYDELVKQGTLKPEAGTSGVPAALPSFDQVRSELERYAIAQAQRDLILDLRKKAKIEMFTAAASTPAQAAKPATPQR